MAKLGETTFGTEILSKAEIERGFVGKSASLVADVSRLADGCSADDIRGMVNKLAAILCSMHGKALSVLLALAASVLTMPAVADAGTVDAGVSDVVAEVDDATVSRLVSDVLSLFVAEGLSAGRLAVTNDTVRAIRSEQAVAVTAQPVAASDSTRAVTVQAQPASAAVSSLRVEVDVIDILLSSGEFASRLGVIRRLIQLRRARGEDVSDLRELVTRILSGSR